MILDAWPLQVPESVGRLVRAVIAWASGRPDVHAVLLVGSYARGEARPDSDIDLLLLVDDPFHLASSWEWAASFGETDRRRVETWGDVTSLRVWYGNGLEAEFGLATPDWAHTPLEPGAAEVLRRGFVLLHDREGLFASRHGAPPVAPATSARRRAARDAEGRGPNSHADGASPLQDGDL